LCLKKAISNISNVGSKNRTVQLRDSSFAHASVNRLDGSALAFTKLSDSYLIFDLCGWSLHNKFHFFTPNLLLQNDFPLKLWALKIKTGRGLREKWIEKRGGT
jgi:hypothetical protein